MAQAGRKDGGIRSRRMGLRGRSAVALGLTLAATVLVAGVIGTTAFGRMRSQLGTSFARDATRLSELRIVSPVARDLALARRFAAVEPTRSWLRTTGDPAAKEAFFRTAESFRGDFLDGSYFVAPASSLDFYYNDESGPHSTDPRYHLDPDNPRHGWFFSTMHNEADYNLNVDHDVGLGVTKLWINVAVYDGDTRIGVAGTGFDLGEVLRDLGVGAEPGVTPIVVNREGFVQLHPDPAQIAEMSGSGALPLADKTLFGLLSGEDEGRARVAMAAAARSPEQVEVFEASVSGRRELLAISYMPELDWFVLSAVDVRVARVENAGFLVPAAAAMLVLALALVMLLVVVVDRRIIAPVKRLELSAQAIAEGRYDVSLPHGGATEIGTLTDAVASMADRVREHTEALDATVVLRTRELERALIDLRAAKDAAERASRAKTDFLARMTHELRTPLNAILGFGQMLQDGPLQTREAEGVKRILGAGNHLLALINEALDMAAIEAGKLAITVEPLVLDRVVVDALELLRPMADAAGVRLEHRPIGRPARVLADPRRLEEVLMNLVANGVKYNVPGGFVAVETKTTAQRVRIEVVDSGPGIAREHLERIFEPFDRAGAKDSGVEGSGLGLALSRRLVEAMGGSLDVQSSPSGTRFGFDLPGAGTQTTARVAAASSVNGA